MKYFLISFLFTALLGYSLCAQTREFGDITIAELEASNDSVFKDEPAIILYRNINFEYGKALEVHERVKIFNEDGFDYSDWTLPFDNLRKLKAATYNLVDGAIEITDVTKKGIFKEEVSDNEEISKLAFPKVKKGSIIELSYRVTFIGFSTLYTQMPIPIKYEEISISNGYYGQLTVRENHYVQLPIKRVKSSFTDKFIGENVPGLKNEDFVGNINNHRGSIHMELHRNNYVQTWMEVAKKFYYAEWFGGQMRNGDALYKKNLKTLLSGETDTLEMVKKIDRYVKDKIEWDQYLSRGTEYVKTVYRDRKGDSGDINMLLVHMLKSVGIRSNPIVVATKNKGWVMYPRIDQFNAVLCAVDVGDDRYILDASEEKTAFAQLPLRYINGFGLIVNTDEEGFELQEIKINETTKKQIISVADIDLENLSVFGSVQKQLTNYYALEHRKHYTDLKEETYSEYLNKLDLLTATEVVKKNLDDEDKPINISYNFVQKDYVEQIGQKLYLQPLLHFGIEENIFKEEDRLYPIDLEHPYLHRYIITFNIPDGYSVASLPDSKLVKMEDGLGFLKFESMQRGNKIQVSFELDIKSHLIPAQYYPAIQSLYGAYLDLSKSKIVLSKL